MASVDDNLSKIPPQNLEAEMAVLGAIMLENEAINRVVEIISADDFYRESHRKIFRGMIELSTRNEPADLITLSELLTQRGEIESIGGSSYLASLTENIPTAANIIHHARIVREKAVIREMIRASTEIATSGYDQPGDVDAFLDEAENIIFAIAEKKVKMAFSSIASMMKDTLSYVEKLYDRKELITGVPTGFKELDDLTAGFQPSDLIIVAGRPGMGKTALALNIATNAAKCGTGVAVFSLEMSKEQLVLRMLCSEARVDNKRVRTGHLYERDFPNLARNAGTLADLSIYIDDTPALSVLELRAKARRLVRDREKKIGLIVVDYLQLMRGHADAQNREQEISSISRSLKALAKELNVAIIAASQLNRKSEDRADKRPSMADLRESGAIEQDADVVILIYREEAYKRDDVSQDKKGLAEIIVEKQRNGPTGVVQLTFLNTYTRFENREYDRSIEYEPADQIEYRGVEGE